MHDRQRDHRTDRGLRRLGRPAVADRRSGPGHPATGKCLDAYGGGSANGTPLGIYTCTGAANQRWTLPA
ncbi:RICIN domain-containing protein [Streptomyces sp. NBC_01005]|uniref:RICIN domain-containing protein n=1 Tax=unclassified Streptomyces TaxID=2593676 RepID=UPI00386391A7|nr:RICIN domain-containing protein [Streptomyces sp. NBC_01005]WTC93142.1 RICIN domain-containing protein [Streptomyces sp. NBC_01650]